MDPIWSYGLLLTNNDPSYDSAERGTREVSLHEAHAADQSLHWDPQRQKIQTGKVGFENMEGRKTYHIVVFVVISLFLRLFRHRFETPAVVLLCCRRLRISMSYGKGNGPEARSNRSIGQKVPGLLVNFPMTDSHGTTWRWWRFKYFWNFHP